MITVFALLLPGMKRWRLRSRELVSINTLIPESQAPLPPPGFHFFLGPRPLGGLHAGSTTHKALRDKSPHNRARRLTPQGQKRTLSVRKPADPKAPGAMTARLPCEGGGAGFRQYGDNRLITVLGGSQSLFGFKGRLIAVVRANY